MRKKNLGKGWSLLHLLLWYNNQPFVDLRNIEVNRRDDINQVTINIEFNINRTPNATESVQVTFDGVGDETSSATGDGAY